MKIILSRKGFDSEYGGIASPILPDGSLLSMPIPSNDSTYFDELSYNGKSYLQLIRELKTNNQRLQSEHCHLDPDIRMGIRKPPEGWKAVFGQVDAAETHLENQGIGVGDIFMFFGWFKKTEEIEGKITYSKGVPDLHLLYGYLQVGEIIRGNDVTNYYWHPHSKYPGSNNTLYIATDRLLIDGQDMGLPGYGVFHYSDELVLTYPGLTRTKWKLPEFFKEVNISYHTKNSFKPEGYFQSAHKGQEFVVSKSSDVTKWVKNIIVNNVEHKR